MQGYFGIWEVWPFQFGEMLIRSGAVNFRGFRQVMEFRALDFRCVGCDIRQIWIFGEGMLQFQNEYCPSCSSFLWYLLTEARTTAKIGIRVMPKDFDIEW